MRFHLRKNPIGCGLPLSLILCLVAGAADAAEAGKTGSEDDYFGGRPVVLSVTRLAQSLADTPGAVTIIDRDMIRRSGAREVFDLLRFVPGFIVGHIGNGANPSANYHAVLDNLVG